MTKEKLFNVLIIGTQSTISEVTSYSGCDV